MTAHHARQALAGELSAAVRRVAQGGADVRTSCFAAPDEVAELLAALESGAGVRVIAGGDGAGGLLMVWDVSGYDDGTMWGGAQREGWLMLAYDAGRYDRGQRWGV